MYMCKKLLNSPSLYPSLSLCMERCITQENVYTCTILNVAIKGIHGKCYLNDKVAFWNINLYTAGSGGDLFILTIKIEMNEKKAIRFILQCSNSSYRRKIREHFLSKSISTSFALQTIQI